MGKGNEEQEWGNGNGGMYLNLHLEVDLEGVKEAEEDGER